MYLLKDKKAVMKFSFLILGLIAIVAIIVYAGGVFADTHTSSANLEPEWSQPGITNDYTVEICNDGPDTVDEVRIYRHMDYTNFVCAEESGWELKFISTKQACHYIAETPDEQIEAGECETFGFSATAPSEDPLECLLQWTFETRDLDDMWVPIYNTTSIDSKAPVTTKTLGEPSKTDGDLEWINSITPITLNAVDMSEECGIGVNKTYYKNILAADILEEEYNGDLGWDCADDPCTNIQLCEDLAGYVNYGDEDWNVYNDPFTKHDEPESCHILYYYSEDKIGNKEEIKTNCFFVDKTPPIGTKEIGDPNYGQCPLPPEKCTGWDCLGDGEKDFFTTGRHDPSNWDLWIWEHIGPGDNDNEVRDQDEYAWINGGNPVPFTVSYNPDTGLVTYNVDGKTLGWTYDLDKAFEYLVIMAKGKHVDEDECDMALTNVQVNSKFIGNVISNGNYEGRRVYLTDAEQVNGFIVTGYASMVWDVGCKQQEIPAFHVFAMNTHDPDPEECWVRDEHLLSGTPITLTCTDQDPHPSGGEEVCYKVSFDGVPDDLTDQYCDADLTTIDEGSEYEGEWCCVPASETIIFEEDSLHDLEYFCRDAVDKKSPIDLEWFRVDSQPPVITKEMIGEDHLAKVGTCPPSSPNDECYVRDDGENGVSISVKDDDTYPGCAVNDITCTYMLWWEASEDECTNAEGLEWSDGWCELEKEEFSDYKEIIFEHDSTHELDIHCEDALGNEVDDNEEFLVDSTPPEVEKTYGEPTKVVGDKRWITSQTPITLTATDEKVGVDYIKYRYCLDSGCYDNGCLCNCGDDNWTTIYDDEETFTIPQDSEHCIEYYAVDKLGNGVNQENLLSQCVYVDNQAPEPEKTITGTQIDGTGEVHKYLTSESTIRIECIDQSPHPVGGEILEWEMYWKEDNCEVDENWSIAINSGQESEGYKEFTDLKDSCHKFVYWCSDALGNVESAPHKEIDIVDNKAPEINKTIIGPRSGDCPPEPGSNDICYIDGITNITVDVVDPDPHPVNQVTCDWSYTVDDGDSIIGGQGLGSPFIVHFPEESEHDLTITCRDALGNTAIDVETFFVDQTGPEITKTYEGPQYPNLILPETEYPHYINSETNITISVDDSLGEHHSGVNKTKYRYGIVEDEYCNGTWVCEDASIDTGWTTLDDPTQGIFQIPDDSCHLIEIYAEDNVEKSSTHKQCVFVDNQPPTPNKTVEEPKTEWYPVDVATDPLDPDATHFYPWIVSKCRTDPEVENSCLDGQDCIDCWKVTTDTKISLNCEDQLPHPVNHETTCFKVELDAEDKTAEYCRRLLQKEPNGEGYCCGGEAPYEFKFREESEHNLAYYCEDALGNKGPIDEEKFKVLGKMFMIRINDKWNLISVPFVLLNDDPDEVFEDLEGLQTVWSYDENGNWHVYRPGENATNDLDHIIPGEGYWLLANCEGVKCGPMEDMCQMLIVGGSLYQAGPVVPPSKELSEGWNLIGYYGTEDRIWYWGPNFPYAKGSKEAYCALYSLRNLDGGLLNPTKWSAVVGYWEPYNPHQWEEYGFCNEMDPGAGYWLSMDAEGNYKPETVCNMNMLEEFMCYFS